MNRNPISKIKKIFYALIGIFILILAFFFIPFSDELRHSLFPYMGVLALIFLILGGVLFYLALKSKIKGKLKLFLLMVGGSSAGFLIFVILHNLVYALFILLFGQDFWKGGDEPFFFTLAIIVCPIAFLVGSVGSLVLFFKEKHN